MHLDPFQKFQMIVKKLFSTFLLLCISISSFAFTVPDHPQGYVHDAAKVLSDSIREDLNQKLFQYDQKTSTQVVVALFPSLEGESLEDLTLQLTEKWKIGTKEHDNGVLLSVFFQEKKIRIDTGYGVEGMLTDLKSDQIIRTVMVPEFRKGDVDASIQKGVEAILGTLEGTFKPPTNKPAPVWMRIFLIPIFFLAIFLSTIFGRSQRTYSRRGRAGGIFVSGGGFSGGGFGGGFSGGGGGFGGGGASGSW